MAEYYELTGFEPGDFVDNHGNYWCTAVFKGQGEPIKWVVKDPTKVKVGDSVYGTISEETSKAGKPYLRFRRENVPEAPTSTGTSPSKHGNDDFAFRCNALNNAVAFTIKNGGDVLQTADQYLGWLKGEPVVAGEQKTGFEKAKQVAESLRKPTVPVDDNMTDAEFASLIENQAAAEIDINDIPF